MGLGAIKAAAFAKAKAKAKAQAAQNAQGGSVSSFLEGLAGSVLGVANDVLAPDFLFGKGATATGFAIPILSTIANPIPAAEKFVGACLEAGGVCADPTKKAAISGSFVPLAPAKAAPSDFNLVKSEIDASGFLLAGVVVVGLYLLTRKAA